MAGNALHTVSNPARLVRSRLQNVLQLEEGKMYGMGRNAAIRDAARVAAASTPKSLPAPDYQPARHCDVPATSCCIMHVVCRPPMPRAPFSPDAPDMLFEMKFVI